MADNIELNAASGGAVIATDDITAVHYQIAKLAYGGLGTATLVDQSTGLPVAGGAPHDSAVAGQPVLIGVEAKDFDGAALPNAVNAEGDAVRLAASLSGVLYVMPVSEDGSAVSTVILGAGTAEIGKLAAGVAEIGNVKNSGTFVVQENGAALTALQKIDNIAHSGQDVALVEHVPISGQLDDAATSAVTEGQIAPVRISSRRALLVEGVASGTALAVLDTNSAAIAASLSVIDDWDETDRAKVNPIVGQAGIAAGAGAVGVTVPRVTLASDDPAVAALQIMDDWDESDRAKVNPIVGQAGIAAGAGAVGVTVPRVTLASDDPGVAALQLIDDGVYVDDTATHTTAVSKGYGMMAVATPTDGSVNANDFGHLAMTVDRKLHVAVMDALPAGANAIGKLAANSGVDIGDVDVTSLPNVTLAAGTNTNEVVGDVAHDSPAAGNPLLMGGYASAAAPADVSGDADAVRAWHLRNGALATVLTAAGALIGGDAANGLDVDVTRLPALAAGTNNIGDVDVLTIAAGTNLIGDVGISVRTSGGATPFNNIDVDETEDAIKAAAGQLYQIFCFNQTNAILYVKLYDDTVANVIVGTTVPVMTIPVPGNNDTDGAGVVLTWAMGLKFTAAITIACTTGVATADTGAPAANAMIVSGAYN